MTTTTKGRR